MKPVTAAELQRAIVAFIESAGKPALIEPGETELPLERDAYAVDVKGTRVVVQAWTGERNLMRRVTGVEEQKPGVLTLAVERFGGRPGRLQIVDLARPQSHTVTRKAARLSYRERFRRSLARQWPSWEIEQLSAEADLSHTLSPSYSRAVIAKGPAVWAALGVPAPDASDAALSFGLIWLEHVRARERKRDVMGLALFLPEASERTTCLRLLHLDRTRAGYRVFACSDSFEQEVDLADYGNLETRLPVLHTAAEEGAAGAWTAQIARAPHVERVVGMEGAVSLRVRGVEFARLAGGELRFGLETKRVARESNVAEIESLAREIARVRAPDGDRAHPLYQRGPESWLESQVRTHLERVDATLRPVPVYGQVPAIAGIERGVLDLLAIDREGRLAVLEVKAEEDVHLPLQALDYWMRVKWHLDRGEFASHGYFPGVAIDPRPPRLLLIAPALRYHPTTETILGHFAPSIEVERIGAAEDWQRDFRVMFRLRGAERPNVNGPAVEENAI